ncbi:MAG: XdhC family protein [Gammaproteobacteria bacterium]|nr:XdhC family protein [Gammaproteobacteria bacterium]
MDLSELSILRQANNWFAAGDRVHLITVLQTWGSSPRQVGALAAIRNGKELTGSVSGGCVEEDLLGRIAAGEFPGPGPTTSLYGESEAERNRLRLPCGGRLSLLVEPVSKQSGLPALVAQLEQRERVVKHLDLATGSVSQTPATVHQKFELSNKTLQHPLGPDWQLCLVGASQVAAYLAEIARPLGYSTTILEPRPEYVESWVPLEGVVLVRCSPDDHLASQKIDNQTAIVTLAHDPRVDDMALVEALASEAFYIGALGSSRSQAGRRERLLAIGLTEAQLGRLYAPAGFAIGSKAPAEIAVSIAAQLTAAKHNLLQVSG